jgi:hypothetical protein
VWRVKRGGAQTRLTGERSPDYRAFERGVLKEPAPAEGEEQRALFRLVQYVVVYVSIVC